MARSARMGEHDDKITSLRQQKAVAIDALDDIEKGAIITQDGVDVTAHRRKALQNVLLKLDATIEAYEGLDARQP
jgi:hypothetical protein